MWIIWKEEFRKIAARKILWIAFFLLLGFAAFRLFIELGHYSVTIRLKIGRASCRERV